LIYYGKEIKMFKNVMRLRYFVILAFILAFTGCSKKGEVQSLREELAQAQEDMQHWKEKYDAMSADMKRVKAARRDLNTQLGSVVNTAGTAEEQLSQYAQVVTVLQSQIQELNALVSEQEAIIAEQEASLQEFMGTLDQASGGQNPYDY
jgi:chromosome segregation ATPase